MTYNLLEEPWIPVLWSSGNVSRVGIKQALTQAGRIRQIAASNPMDRVAILRFLLALLYWCKGNPLADTSITPDNSFPADWFSKLDENRDCFDLLGGGKRFYQYRKGGDTQLTANYLIHEIPTGTNCWHFRHSADEVDGLCPACCAMGLLRLPLFATQGGKGKSPGINQAPPIYVIPLGRTLAEIIRLSWRPASNLGTPAWEKPDIPLPKIGEVPLLTGLTWLPRRVWLGEPQENESHCISCGGKEHLILSSVFAGIGSTKTDDNSPARVWRDPHVIYQESRKGENTTVRARNAIDAADAGAALWANTVGGICRIIEGRKATSMAGGQGAAGNDAIEMWVVGFSTDQNKYLEATEFTLPLRRSLREATTEVIERWQEETKPSNLARRLRPPGEKERSIKHTELRPMVAAIQPHVEHTVSAKAGELLSGGEAGWREASREYRPMMETIATSLSPGFTTAAVRRRRQIASVLPDMSQKTTEVKKPAKGKRGVK